ncbi:MAG: 4Fe-4S dicluster domain-containing protein [Clostridia bacterium]|nr:4Fe-4S dicluster domain-containing protein [Clostridia bacterium]
MQRLEIKALEKASELLSNGTVNRVLGWKKGEFCYDVSPAVFNTVEELKEFVYNGFCGANLSKYLIAESKKEGKILVFLKPCDTYSFNQLIKEHRINKDNVYVVGIECQGKFDIEKFYKMGVEFVSSIEESVQSVKVNGEKELSRDDVKLERCLVCDKKHVAYDELIEFEEKLPSKSDRFEMVKKLEAMTADERYAFWKQELSKCIRCNACRNVCPACNCTKCVFDNPNSEVSSKANADSFEEKLFHIIRAFHVAGRCTDCGECSRVCPQNIPLHLLNRKFIGDINRLYGEYQAGEDTTSRGPLTNFTKEDAEPSEAVGGNE